MDFFQTPLAAENKRERTKEINRRVKKAKEHKWRQVQANKSTLLLYHQHKDIIAPVPLHDNGLASVLLFELRAGACVLLSVNKHTTANSCVVCRMCGRADETIAHIVKECKQLSPPDMNTDLTATLRFVGADFGIDDAAVRVSKIRLEQWRRITLQGLWEEVLSPPA
ncbi:hypothetical protein MRX96_028439 [Rhipicephalus microplus]